MPNGNKRRPDTLELEVLRATATATATSSAAAAAANTTATLQQSVNGERRYDRDDSAGRLRARCPETALTPLQKRSRQERRPSTPRERWFHFGQLFARRRSQLNGHNNIITTTTTATATTTTTRNSTTFATTTADLGLTSATLARPEPSTIDNSTTTILTLSPQTNDDSITTAAAAASTTVPATTTDNLPDVAAVLPRKNSKRRSRSKSQSDSLYSLATLAQTGEVQLHTRNDSVKRFRDKDTTTNLDGDTSASSLLKRKVEAKDKVLLTSMAGEAVSIEPQTQIDLDELADGLNNPTKSGFRAHLKSYLNKLAIWKNSHCSRRPGKS